MGIMPGLIAAATWGVLWPVAFKLLGIPGPAAIVAWIAGLIAAFVVGYRLGSPRYRGDPVSRIEERQRARQRYEARARQLEVEDRQARLARADRGADEGAEARGRELGGGGGGGRRARRAASGSSSPGAAGGDPAVDLDPGSPSTDAKPPRAEPVQGRVEDPSGRPDQALAGPPDDVVIPTRADAARSNGQGSRTR